MAAQRGTHPSTDVLKALGTGKLDEGSSSKILKHLDQCEECNKRIGSLFGEKILHLLRRPRGQSAAFVQAEANSQTSVGKRPSVSRDAIPNLPPELASNSQYQILRELGRGGMGVVYLAKNTLMDRLEVLKVVNRALLDHPGAAERFLREIRSAAKLSHANVVGAYSAVQQGELLAFAMEYVEGQDLASVVKAQGPLPILHACYYTQQAASGLHHAFEKGMVHRDIKPQNLILAREGKKHTVKVLDFGLAKVMREKSEDTGLTAEGQMLGTPDYIAPEQTLDAAKADIRADIYSLGCTLYYLLAGHPPFSANNLAAMALAHQMQEARPLNLVRPEVPVELAAVVRKMMAKSPAKRYQTPREVVQALAPFVKQGGTSPLVPHLSSGSLEAKPLVKMSPDNLPPVSAAESRKEQPEQEPVWESLTQDRVTSSGQRKGDSLSKRQPATARTHLSTKWLLVGGLGMGVLLLALVGMWASGGFREEPNIGERADGESKVLSPKLESARVAPPKDPFDLWFAEGTRWEGKAVFPSGVSGAWWFTILSRAGDKFKGRLVGQGRFDLTIEGSLDKDGTSFHWTNFRETPNVWRPQQEFESGISEGKCMTDRTRVDFHIKRLDGQEIEGYCEFTTRSPGPRKDDEEIWPPPLQPRLATLAPAGKWSIDGDELVQEEFVEDVNNNPVIFFGDLAWRDYDLHLKAMKTGGENGFIVIFDGVRPGRKITQWCIGLVGNRQTYVEIVEWHPTTGVKLIPLSEHKPCTIADNQWYDILIKTRNEQIECLLDGESIFTIPHADRCGGKVGFTCLRMTGRFKDIEVTAPDGKVLWKQGPPELP